MFYDAEGNRTKHILPEAYDAQKDDGKGWGYTYAPENRLKTVTGQDGVLLYATEYDLSGNLTAETDAAGRTSYRKYTLNGQPRADHGSGDAAGRKLCSGISG